jgi:hypothetical protein
MLVCAATTRKTSRRLDRLTPTDFRKKSTPLIVSRSKYLHHPTSEGLLAVLNQMADEAPVKVCFCLEPERPKVITVLLLRSVIPTARWSWRGSKRRVKRITELPGPATVHFHCDAPMALQEGFLRYPQPTQTSIGSRFPGIECFH